MHKYIITKINKIIHLFVDLKIYLYICKIIYKYKNMGKVIILGNQKGGVGKTTITSYLANFLFYQQKELLIVVDADNQQQSIFNFRQNDLRKGVNEADLYDVFKTESKEFEKFYQTFIDNYKYVFVDLPGNLEQEGVIVAYALSDVIFIPFKPFPAEISSTVIYYNMLIEKVEPLRKKAGLPPIKIYAFLNAVNSNMVEVKKCLNCNSLQDFIKLYPDQYDFNNINYKLFLSDAIKPLKLLKSYIPDYGITFKRFVTTVKIYQKDDTIKLNLFNNEILSLINS